MKSDETKSSNFSNFVELLQYRGKHQKNKTAYIFLDDGETKELKLTYGQLDSQARAIAAKLQQTLSPGDRAILLYPPSLEFMTGFFGCLYAGVVAVPVYPPNPSDLKRSVDKLKGIIDNAGPKIALTNKDIILKLRLLSLKYSVLRKMKWIASDSIKESLSEKWRVPEIKKDDLAFLQYTSGSTGEPKGVMVSHGNLMYNNEIIKLAFGHTEESIGTSWLPVYHDMGLIGKVLQPVYLGTSCIHMSPIAFLQKPLRWLQAISKYKVTTSGGPNFAYELCTRRITPEQLKDLDLSSWEVAFSGAEQVHTETLKKFAEVFKPCGFQETAFYPCYGLAEATLAVSGGLKKELPVAVYVDKTALAENKVLFCEPAQENAQAIVGCGKTWLDQKIFIVDPDTLKECPRDDDNYKIGEIWVKGESVVKGYWNNPGKTEETFNAYLADTGEGPFLRTEDLGFIKDGELFIAGRIKDLIIIGGRNHYPQDIEHTLEGCASGLRPGCCAAFSVDVENKEQLVIVQEVKNDKAASMDTGNIFKAMRNAVLRNHGLQVHTIVLIKAKTILKTSSGKLRRNACRDMFLNDSLALVAKDSLGGKTYDSDIEINAEVKKFQFKDESVKDKDSFQKIQKTILNISSDILGIEEDDIAADADMSEYGFDSITLIEFISCVNDTYDLELTASVFFDHNTAESFAYHIYTKTVQSGSEEISDPSVKSIYNKPIPDPHNELNMFISRFFTLISKKLWNIKATGINNVPQDEPFILCLNHESHLDGFWAISFLAKDIRKKLCCFSKKEHFDFFLSRFAIKLMGAVPVDRYGDTSASLLTGEKVLKEGRSLLIHPEGTRTRTGDLLPFKRGSASLSIAANVPIVPVRIMGAYAVYPVHKFFPGLFDWRNSQRFKIDIRFGKPIYPSFSQNTSLDTQLSELTEKVRSAIISLGSDKG
ncbi:MAG: AMP-binding protein [Desulfobacula sp.]|nr:AMP-binding protein [Desulfobacula sp.]